MVNYQLKKSITNVTFILIIVSLVFTECGQRKNIEEKEFLEDTFKTIQVPLKKGQRSDFSFNDIIEQVSLMPLETTELSLLQASRDIVVEDRIYIANIPDELFIFSRDGRFINKTKKGRGPNELTQLLDFQLTGNGGIAILEFKEIKFFDNNLTVQKKYTITPENGYLNPDNFCWFDADNYYLWQNATNGFSELPPEESFHLFKMNRGNIVESYLKPFSYTPYKRYFEKDKDGNYYLLPTPYDNHIYKITPEGVEKGYYIDFGNHNVNLSEFTRGFSRKIGYGNLSRLKNYATRISMFVPLDNNFLFSFRFDSKFQYGLYNRQNESVRVFSSDECIIDGILPYRIIAKDRETNAIVGLTRPSDFLANLKNNNQELSPGKHLNKKAIELLKNVKMNDNPLLVFVKLK